MGFVYEKENTRKTLIKLIAFLVPFFSGVFYFLLPNPITLLLIAGIWAAMGLPIVNIGAIYLSNKLQKELQPSLFIKLILWLSLLFQFSIAVLIVIDISANF